MADKGSSIPHPLPPNAGTHSKPEARLEVFKLLAGQRFSKLVDSEWVRLDGESGLRKRLEDERAAYESLEFLYSSSTDKLRMRERIAVLRTVLGWL
jgi:hypothetical protein